MISEKTIYPYDKEELYYFVREGYISDPASTSARAEGYCKEIKVTSEMICGSLQIDSYYRHDLGIGDVFTVKSGHENSLKCIQLIY